MTTTQTLIANKSAQFALFGSSTDLGAGQDQHLPIGWHSGAGARYRAAIAFPAIAWPAHGALVSATLKLRTATQVHVAHGGSPRIRCRRITGAWTANAASQDSGSMSSSATTYPGPASTSSGDTDNAVTSSESTLVSIDVTDIVRAVAPVALGGGGASWLGIAIIPGTEADSSDTVEFWSAKASTSSNRPTLTVVIDPTAPPNAPTLTTPRGTGAATALFAFTYSHPDGLELNAYDLEVREWIAGAATGPVAWTVTASATGLNTATNSVSRAYAGTALSNARTYAWRARGRDTLNVYGAWSAWATFTPGDAVVDPYARWAGTILDALADPAPLSRLGTIRPSGPAETLPLVTAEYGARWRLVDEHVTPGIDRIVRVVGMRVRLSPADPKKPGTGGVDVTATTEDVEAGGP